MAANSPFVLSSFMKGAARILDIGSTQRKRQQTFIKTDADAMRQDWVTVGKELDGAMVDYDSKFKQAKR
ncbi:hypothetical protein [Secundilactobacillus kimchicus]|nr:hypothetical protein [Secundilactobacillus kimchicus]MBT9672496.1 hypothetical protein [Secundilactobacillus kimchicus]